MQTTVFIDETEIKADNFEKTLVSNSEAGKDLYKISFDFKVTSEDYHDIAVLLYRMDFIVRLPEEDLEFPASISNYSTSVTNLYIENQIADYRLELIEKP